MNEKGHGVALFSGGLDSALAILLMLQQNIRVTALMFMTHFGCDINDKSSCSHDPEPLANRFGFTVKMVHLGHKFTEIVRNPRYGHGKNMNPCIDCRILMLREAAHFMNIVDADFVFTGEVVGQRPMSQHKPSLNLVMKESGLEGRLVRPLSAKILPPTKPELSGLLDREKLEGISGRSRKRQLELAEQFGVEDLPNPAAGCLLTDVGYSRRLRDLFSHTEQVTFNDLNLLKVGRHFRLEDGSKVVVGRNEEENKKILAYRDRSNLIFEAMDSGSPITILIGDASEKNIAETAGITARYCDQKTCAEVEVSYYLSPEDTNRVTVAPAKDTLLETIRL